MDDTSAEMPVTPPRTLRRLRGVENLRRPAAPRTEEWEEIPLEDLPALHQAGRPSPGGARQLTTEEARSRNRASRWLRDNRDEISDIQFGDWRESRMAELEAARRGANIPVRISGAASLQSSVQSPAPSTYRGQLQRWNSGTRLLPLELPRRISVRSIDMLTPRTHLLQDPEDVEQGPHLFIVRGEPRRTSRLVFWALGIVGVVVVGVIVAAIAVIGLHSQHKIH